MKSGIIGGNYGTGNVEIGDDSAPLIGAMVTANVFDPISDQLDQRVFNGETPKPTIVKFITNLYDHAFYKEFGVHNDGLVHLYLTGSLTTYQYGPSSDCDVSAFPNYTLLIRLTGQDAGTIRKRLIKMNIEHLDGTFLPGGSHPIQVFALPEGAQPQDRFVKGIRSGWDFQTKKWLVPPEKDRVHSIEKEFPEVYARAAGIADKMTEMLDAHNYKAAAMLWENVHRKRQLDQQHGGGDYSEGNIVYKFLVHEGIVDRLRHEMGLQIETKVVPINVPTDEWHGVISPNRIPWIADPVKDKIWIGSPGSSHLQLMHEDDEISDGYERSWEGCYVNGTREVVIYSQYDNENFTPDQIPQELIKLLHEAFGEIEIEYPDVDGDYVKLATIRPITIKVIYDPEKDHIILGTMADATNGKTIIGEYHNDEVTLQHNPYSFINANYFRRLWAFSYPHRPLHKVHIQDGITGDKIELPTKPPRHVQHA